MSSKQKLTVYVPPDVYDEMKAEAERQERTISWMVEHTWKVARSRVLSYPSVQELCDDLAVDAAE